MKYLLDTHLLLWTMIGPEKLLSSARALIEDGTNQIHFSVASIWEASIKWSRGRPDFQFEPQLFRRTLIVAGFEEIRVAGEHAVAVATLPPIHKDPFDRILIAQATVEGITLLTSDAWIARYPGPILRV